MKVTALIPIKTNSTRLKNKNFLDFCGQPLYQVVLDTLQSIDEIDRIVINTDSEIIATDCALRYPKAVIIHRPEHLKADSITMNTLIAHDITTTENEHFLQTHCTNPLLSKQTIVNAIKTYFNNLTEYDSLFSIETIRKRGYFSDGKPVNHSNELLLQTQDLDPVCIENSNIFLFSRSSFIDSGNSRIGKKPFLFQMSTLEGIDIDLEEDFVLAALIHRNKSLFDFAR